MNAWQLMQSAHFPLELLITLGLSILVGLGLGIGARIARSRL